MLTAAEQPVWKNKMVSNVSGTLLESPSSWAKSAGAKSNGDSEDLELSGAPRCNSCETSSGDFLDPTGESERHENVDTNFQVNLGQMEEKKPVPAALVSSPMALAPAASRRNPPDGKADLVLS
ncbi:hematological and neurological expressed 1 protein [Cricetulus griseus]|nr:hematological and neurological expressed 1 protein [Cricetulus griseus]